MFFVENKKKKGKDMNVINHFKNGILKIRKGI